MSEITCTDGSLTVTLDGDHDSRRIHKFLTNLSFRLRGSVWTSRNTDPRLIIRIQNYIQSRPGEVNLDDRVQACVQAFQENELLSAKPDLGPKKSPGTMGNFANFDFQILLNYNP